MMPADKLKAQHARLERLFERLAECPSIPDGHPVAGVILTELREALTVHFSDEEAFMRQFGWLDLSGHEAEHCYLLGLVETLNGQWKMQSVSLQDAIHVIQRVIVDHMNETDAAMLRSATSRSVKTCSTK